MRAFTSKYPLLGRIQTPSFAAFEWHVDSKVDPGKGTSQEIFGGTQTCNDLYF